MKGERERKGETGMKEVREGREREKEGKEGSVPFFFISVGRIPPARSSTHKK
jgi:hypothetical protein